MRVDEVEPLTGSQELLELQTDGPIKGKWGQVHSHLGDHEVAGVVNAKTIAPLFMWYGAQLVEFRLSNKGWRPWHGRDHAGIDAAVFCQPTQPVLDENAMGRLLRIRIQCGYCQYPDRRIGHFQLEVRVAWEGGRRLDIGLKVPYRRHIPVSDRACQMDGSLKHPSHIAKRCLLLGLVTAAIVYGSLYPFVFRLYDTGWDGLYHLLGTWRDPPESRGDLIVNILLYMPLGFAVANALIGKWRAVFAAVIVGAALSFSIEWLQFYDQSRVSCLSDFALNVIGSLAGALISRVRALRVPVSRLPQGGQAVFARVLLFAWLAWRLYPYVPTIDLHKYWNSLKPIVIHHQIDAYDTFRFAVLWLGVSHLLGKGLRPKVPFRLLGAAMVGYFCAKVLIINQYLSLSEIVGAATALVLSGLPDTRLKLGGLAALFTATVICSRLLPWIPSSIIRPFQWVPFYGLLHGSLAVDIQSFCEKTFLYGTLLLLLVEVGVPLSLACLGECLVLLSTSAVETLTADRSAEITDVVIALLLALAYVALDRSARRGHNAV
jgi:VanZ family protein